MNYKIDPAVNEFEALIVIDDLRKKGVTHADMRPGNRCVWVSHSQLETYYIFRDGKLIDIQID
jgi:mannose-6-phosphate isomerase-like protein (cupin superfamily)